MSLVCRLRPGTWHQSRSSLPMRVRCGAGAWGRVHVGERLAEQAERRGCARGAGSGGLGPCWLSVRISSGRWSSQEF
ncbi:MAG: hypothetical protein EHM14_11365 [Methanothrix sp.]|nr:MAG: hypothetical protein EHM14_11365 [Methanothrix sp.]